MGTKKRKKRCRVVKERNVKEKVAYK